MKIDITKEEGFILMDIMLSHSRIMMTAKEPPQEMQLLTREYGKLMEKLHTTFKYKTDNRLIETWHNIYYNTMRQILLRYKQ